MVSLATDSDKSGICGVSKWFMGRSRATARDPGAGGQPPLGRENVISLPAASNVSSGTNSRPFKPLVGDWSQQPPHARLVSLSHQFGRDLFGLRECFLPAFRLGIDRIVGLLLRVHS